MRQELWLLPFLPLAFEILRLIKNFKIKIMIYFTYQNALKKE